MTHICVIKQTIINWDNGLAPGRRQAIIWTNAGILLTGPLGTTFSGILIGIQTFSFKKMDLKMSSAKWRPFGLGLNVLRHCDMVTLYAMIDLCRQVHFRELLVAWQCQAITWTNASCSRLILIHISTKFLISNSKLCIWNRHLQNGVHFIGASACQVHNQGDEWPKKNGDKKLWCQWSLSDQFLFYIPLA